MMGLFPPLACFKGTCSEIATSADGASARIALLHMLQGKEQWLQEIRLIWPRLRVRTGGHMGYMVGKL